MYKFGHVITMDEQYVIILGYVGGGKEYHDDIFVLDLKTMVFTESNVKLPYQNKMKVCKAVIMSEESEGNLLIHGFIRKVMNMYDIDIPSSLIILICSWYPNEYIYIINAMDGDHWKISVDKIFN